MKYITVMAYLCPLVGHSLCLRNDAIPGKLCKPHRAQTLNLNLQRHEVFAHRGYMATHNCRQFLNFQVDGCTASASPWNPLSLDLLGRGFQYPINITSAGILLT